MTRRTSYLDVLRPGGPCPVLAAVPAAPVWLMTRRSYNLQHAGVMSWRGSAPRSVFPAERWWTSHPS
uniref:Uncharacterized protein n=1 Tax=Schlesneria paludicola TaxID=360056 RepID=A0A7C4LJD1_9PLAN